MNIIFNNIITLKALMAIKNYHIYIDNTKILHIIIKYYNCTLPHNNSDN